MFHWAIFFTVCISLACTAPAPEPAPAPGPEPKPKADPAYLAAPLVYSAAAAAVPVAHSYSSVSQYTSHPVHAAVPAVHAAVPIAKAAPFVATPYVAASAPAAVYSYPTYPAYHPNPAVGSVYNYPYVLV